MKAFNCKHSLLLVALLLAGTALSANEAEKSLHKEFKTNNSTVLSMDLKFSELNVTTWDQDQAVFDVSIVVNHKDGSKAEKILDLINVEFEKNGNTITVEVVFNEKFNKIKWGESSNFEVIIDAKIPSDINFDLENKFGSVTINELSGIVSIVNYHGSLNIDRLLGNEIDLELHHSDTRITEIGNATVELNFGSMHVVKAGDLNLEAGYAECKIGTTKNLSAEINQSDLEINKITSNFSEIDIENNMGSVEIGIDKNAGFKFSCEMQMGSINIPKFDKVENKKNYMSRTIKATHGNGQSTITLEGQMGNFDISFK